MNKILFGIAILLVSIALFFGGLFLGQANATGIQPGWMMAGDQRGLNFVSDGDGFAGCDYGSGAGMMNGGMMDNGFGMMGNSYGMMNGGFGMMGGYNLGSASDADPLSIEDAEVAVNRYLTSLGNDNLVLGEVMIFDNHAYAQILDLNSESGAFEVLVDPASHNVFPEPGPNMMWNTEYSPMSDFGGYGMMGGGMMGGNVTGSFTTGSEISVSEQEAIEFAQQYLDTYLPGKTADETADPFPGYYTIHILDGGNTFGMLSVNAYTEQVFFHHWHGEFLDMAGEEHN